MSRERSLWIALVVLLLIPWIWHFGQGLGRSNPVTDTQGNGPSFRRQSIVWTERGEPPPQSIAAPEAAPAPASPATAASPQPPAIAPVPYITPYFPPPERAEFCGERVPLENQEVRERFDREFTVVVYSHAQVYLWLKRMERYFPWIENQLAVNKLPQDLKFLAVAESDLNMKAMSSAGAAGPWQFISGTGQRYGLCQTPGLDQRYDFELATAGAFRYLGDLYRLFDNWTLAAAGYNCGEKRVRDEMTKQKVSSYYHLKLPLETERYVFRILAIKEVLTHPEKYGYYLPKGCGYPPLRVDQVAVNAAVSVQAVAECAGTTYRHIKSLNPALTSDTIPPGSHKIKVPEGTGPDVKARVEAMKSSRPATAAAAPPAMAPAAVRPAPTSHKVKKGETLSEIAEHYRVSSADLRRWNGIKGEQIKVGQVLKINK